MTSNIKQRRLMDRNAVLLDRAGIPSPRSIQRQIAAANKPDTAPVVTPQPITAAIKGGGAMKQFLEAADTLGHITDLSTIGTDPIVPLSDSASALDDLTSAGIVVRLGPGSYVTQLLTIFATSSPALAVTRGNGGGVGVPLTLSLSTPLNAIGQLGTSGMVSYDFSGPSAHARTISSGSSGVSVADGDGIAGNPTISLNALLTAIATGGAGGLVVFNGSSASTSTTTSTTNTISYVTALSFTWGGLTAGTYTILAFGMHRATRTAAGLINTKVTVDGTDGTVLNSTQDASVNGAAYAYCIKAGITTASPVITLSYKNNAAATATSESPMIVAIALRTA